MVSPLKKARKEKGMTLKDLQEKLKNQGLERSISHLSQLENGLFWPSRDVVSSLVSIFKGSITEMQILYPKGEESKNA